MLLSNFTVYRSCCFCHRNWMITTIREKGELKCWERKLRTGAGVINKFWCCLTTHYSEILLWLNVASNVTKFNQLDCFIYAQRNYAMVKFVYHIGSWTLLPATFKNCEPWTHFVTHLCSQLLLRQGIEPRLRLLYHINLLFVFTNCNLILVYLHEFSIATL